MYTTSSQVFQLLGGKSGQGREQCRCYTNMVASLLSAISKPTVYQYKFLFQKTRLQHRWMCHLRMMAALVASSPDYKPSLPICPRLWQQTERLDFSCSAHQDQLTDFDWRRVSGLKRANTLTGARLKIQYYLIFDTLLMLSKRMQPASPSNDAASGTRLKLVMRLAKWLCFMHNI